MADEEFDGVTPDMKRAAEKREAAAAAARGESRDDSADADKDAPAPKQRRAKPTDDA